MCDPTEVFYKALPVLLAAGHCALCPFPGKQRLAAPEKVVRRLASPRWCPDGPHCLRPPGIWPGASGLARCSVLAPFPAAPGEKAAATGAFPDWSAVKVITGHEVWWSLVAVGTGQNQQQPKRKSVSGRSEGLCTACGSPRAPAWRCRRLGWQAALAGEPTQRHPGRPPSPVRQATCA